MKSSICSFFGHRNIYSGDIESGLYAEIERHITEMNTATFYVGGYGAFDGMASGILHKMKERYPHITVYRVLAYLPTTADSVTCGKQHPTIYPEGLELVSRRFAINHRNRWIVTESDYIIAYVCRKYGGAYSALKHAKAKNKQIVNLADKKE